MSPNPVTCPRGAPKASRPKSAFQRRHQSQRTAADARTVHERVREPQPSARLVRPQLGLFARQQPREPPRHAAALKGRAQRDRLPVEVGRALGAEDGVVRRGLGGGIRRDGVGTADASPSPKSSRGASDAAGATREAARSSSSRRQCLPRLCAALGLARAGCVRARGCRDVARMATRAWQHAARGSAARAPE